MVKAIQNVKKKLQIWVMPIVTYTGGRMSKNYTTRLDDEMIERIKIQAAKERINVCLVIQKAISEYLEKTDEGK